MTIHEPCKGISRLLLLSTLVEQRLQEQLINSGFIRDAGQVENSSLRFLVLRGWQHVRHQVGRASHEGSQSTNECLDHRSIMAPLLKSSDRIFPQLRLIYPNGPAQLFLEAFFMNSM